MPKPLTSPHCGRAVRRLEYRSGDHPGSHRESPRRTRSERKDATEQEAVHNSMRGIEFGLISLYLPPAGRAFLKSADRLTGRKICYQSGGTMLPTIMRPWQLADKPLVPWTRMSIGRRKRAQYVESRYPGCGRKVRRAAGREARCGALLQIHGELLPEACQGSFSCIEPCVRDGLLGLLRLGTAGREGRIRCAKG
jgi:hypothetical protein